MTLLLAATVGVLFGAGAFMLLKPDLFRVAAGVVLVSNAATLSVMAAGRRRGEVPIVPYEGPVSDPLVQAMAVTAIVIGFAVATLIMTMVYRVYRSEETVDLDVLSRTEAVREEEAERREEGEEPR